ncbi:glycosyltransferase family 2 protein [Agromyces italicus]|uniref:glycosyltransferase family 2 protein n=1 Tax=Agromyces italicus TaxID=279572 RepID=UPI0003B6A67D|nr:glycosyltransferase [Agromyces italicus]
MADDVLGAPRIEVVVGVHTEARPIERLVSSALHSQVPLRVTIVVHNTPPEAIRARLGDLADDPRVRLLALDDGVRSPANAFNAGLDVAEGEFVSVIGSDDEFAPGALDAWIEVADASRADVVVAPVRRDDGGMGTAPRPRPGRIRALDGDRDRLFERAAPLGLVRRSRFPDLRFTVGLPRGEDQAYTLELWFSGANVVFDAALPPYLEHGDQDGRVTFAPGRAEDDFAFLIAMESSSVFSRMTVAARRAVAAKLLRVHVIGAIASRLSGSGLDEADRTAIDAAIARVLTWAPGVQGILARRDRALIAAFRAGNDTAVREMLRGRASLRSPSALITADPFRMFSRHAPLRSLLAQRRAAERMAAARRDDAAQEGSRAG